MFELIMVFVVFSMVWVNCLMLLGVIKWVYGFVIFGIVLDGFVMMCVLYVMVLLMVWLKFLNNVGWM